MFSGLAGKRIAVPPARRTSETMVREEAGLRNLLSLGSIFGAG
jgi:hypothetical protein